MWIDIVTDIEIIKAALKNIWILFFEQTRVQLFNIKNIDINEVKLTYE